MRKKEGDKHSLILDAATRVFCKVGFERAQVATIAVESGIATGSVYLYFRSKEEVLDRVFERCWIELALQMKELQVTNPLDALRAQLGLFFDRMADFPELGMLYLKEHHRFLERKPAEGYNAYVICVNQGIEAFQEGVRLGLFPKQNDIPFSRAFIFGGVHAAVQYLFANPGSSKKIIREQMIQMALASLSRTGAKK